MSGPLPYRGRFAPSPTGQLHFGSLVAAVASYLEARTRKGNWLVRMEDLDPPREVSGAADDILRTLEAFGFEWDEPVLYQSQRSDAYRAALDQLIRNDHCFSCRCSRRDIQLSAAKPEPTPVYPGTCRQRPARPDESAAIRFRVTDEVIRFEDPIQGSYGQHMASEVGDFVIRRADGLFAYQLAVVVDDEYQGITDIVRGVDLIDSTPRQIGLQQALAYATPRYNHVPIATDTEGKKLGKHSQARPVDRHRPVPALIAALKFLGQAVPTEANGMNLSQVWQWGRENWARQAVPRRRHIAVS